MASRQTGMDLTECQRLRERWELSQREFKELRHLSPEEYKDFVPVFRISEVRLDALMRPLMLRQFKLLTRP